MRRRRRCWPTLAGDPRSVPCDAISSAVMQWLSMVWLQAPRLRTGSRGTTGHFPPSAAKATRRKGLITVRWGYVDGVVTVRSRHHSRAIGPPAPSSCGNGWKNSLPKRRGLGLPSA